jgi:hypothetical protein
VVALIAVRARMFPANRLPVPSVAELPTCQKTLHDWAPLTSLTVLAPGPAAVTSVEAVLKMNTAFGLPPPFRVSVPVMPKSPAAES